MGVRDRALSLTNDGVRNQPGQPWNTAGHDGHCANCLANASNPCDQISRLVSLAVSSPGRFTVQDKADQGAAAAAP